MNFFSRQKTRTPADIVKSLKDNIIRLDNAPAGEASRKVRYLEINQQVAFGYFCGFRGGRIAIRFHKIRLWPTREYPLTMLPTQVNEDISRQLSIVKTLLSGEGDTEPNPDAVAQVANEMYAQDLLSSMVVHLGKFDFEVCHSSMTVLLCPFNRICLLPRDSFIREWFL